MDIIQFLGRFHVLLLHLPIGILFMAAVIEIYWVYKKQPRNTLIKAVWLWGAFTAVGAATLGYLLSLGGGYSQEAIATHRNWAVGVIICAFFCWFYLGRLANKKQTGHGKKIVGLSVLQLLLLFSTGHYGANMTHGETYLVEHAPIFVQKLAGLKVREPVTSVEQAQIYPDVIEPLLLQRCSGCHNDQKAKGRLSFASYQSTLSKVVVANDLASSELYRRITLDAHDKKFMPAEGKTPLTDEQVKLIAWWIEKGAQNQTTVTELQANAEILRGIAQELKLGEFSTTEQIHVAELSEQVVIQLEQAGFHVSRIQQGQPFVRLIYANNKQDITEQTITALLQAKEQIKWLKLAKSSVTDQQLSQLAELKNLTWLDLSNTQISEQGLTHFANKANLKINTFNTQVEL
ncbi:c-type cytochrome domain-containing protein [Gayadomonas joobiniege]|uniref:c-type cytochrome domain-containing protein n=1 Tax=Gayadomonas joobiniege TaxID=1234606 RepID=UPI0003632194|nr:c-type cytochrome domain-containing protein [Gayadomonas joobiniege]